MKFALSLGVFLIAVGSGLAGPLQRSHLAGDSIWFAHLDIDKFKQAQAGQFLLGELDKPEIQAKFAAFQAIFNFDPRKTLRGCSLYSRGVAPEDALLLLDGSFDADRLVTLAKGAKDYRVSQHRGYWIHSWIDESKPARARAKPRSYGAMHASGLLILGQKSERLTEALDVLDKIQPSLEGTNLLSPLGASAGSAFLVAAARRTELAARHPHAEMLRHVKVMCLAAGESENQLKAETVLETENEETAKQILAINQGLVALMAMRTDNPGAVKLAQGTTVTQSDAKVVVSLKLVAAEVVQWLKDAAAKKAAKP